ncbi:hypothetical protein CGLO_17809 [Colletotrichum gloeosporioides Cg-14]|uniref:Uncharacterized protein n=1 Tax=Colletotrichum gloeosporioides (strain Cg-14) TaxID=1237896 RepID=T0JVY2_COLGC|nr:hypothetical protein CGLO_17809 [Colletotrichum gloeosporioides Cg-14]
MCRRLVAD